MPHTDTRTTRLTGCHGGGAGPLVVGPDEVEDGVDVLQAGRVARAPLPLQTQHLLRHGSGTGQQVTQLLLASCSVPRPQVSQF